jgi:outer membrane protein, multidrug efflux system
MTLLTRRIRLAAAAILSTMLAACAPVGPNYARPSLPTPPQYRFIEGAAQGESLADAPWWTVFQDPTLQALIREAIANNLDLRAAVARVTEARERVGVVKSFRYPQVDATAAYTFQQNSSSGSSQTTTGQTTQTPNTGQTTRSTAEDDDSGGGVHHGGIYGLQLSWELDLFGRIRRQEESAYAVLLATEQGRRGVIVTLVGDVASNYFRLRELDLELQIARQTLRINDELVTYFRNRLEGGVSSRLELDRAAAFRGQTAAAIPDIEQRIAIVEQAISLLLGRVPGGVDRTALEAAAEPPPSIPPGLPATLLERRPDVVEAEQMLVAANADIGAAKALFFPTVSLTGFLGGISGEVASLLGSSGGVWTAGPSLLQPIFQGGRLRHNLAAMRARFDVAVAEYQKAALNGYREVANALVTIQKLAQVREQRLASVTALRDAADLARSRYDSGLASYFEIIEADQQLFQQQLLLAQTQGTELEARADLYRALGGGWQQ